MHFKSSTLYICKYPNFDVTKITKFWSALHNANSSLLLLFTCFVVQTNYIHKRFHFNSPFWSRYLCRSRRFNVFEYQGLLGVVESKRYLVSSTLREFSYQLFGFLMMWLLQALSFVILSW